MFAVVALILFVLALFLSHLGPFSLLTLGWVCIAAHLAFGVGIPWLRRSP